MEEGVPSSVGETPTDGATGTPQFIQRICCHCGVLLNVPENEPIIVCGACKKSSKIVEMRPKRTYDGYLHTGCCCYKLTSCFPKQSFFYLAIVLTSFIIGGGFTAVAPEILPPFQTTSGCILWSVSAFLSVNVVCNFIYARTTDPGLPDEHPESLDGGAPLIALPPCTVCSRPKPPRTHHCRTCNRCVLDMDHHCVFLDRCVGRHNFRFFLAFLLWVAVACAFVLYFCLSLLQHRIRHASWIPHVDGTSGSFGGRTLGKALAARLLPPQNSHKILMPGQLLVGGFTHVFWLFITEAGPVPAALAICSGVTCVLTIMLLSYHLYLSYHGKTQMESSFHLDPGVPTAKGCAGIKAAFSAPPPAAPGVWLQQTAWWVGVLLPLPPSLTGPKGHAN